MTNIKANFFFFKKKIQNIKQLNTEIDIKIEEVDMSSNNNIRNKIEKRILLVLFFF
jgi:hypothetical protein